MIVLDTHAWVWWVYKKSKLGRAAARALERTDRIGIPAICPWEVAMKVEAGKLKLDRPCAAWVDDALASDSRVALLPLLPAIAVAAVELSWRHRDPADRIIVATARAHDAPLLSSDDEIHESKLVRCIWD